MSDAVANLLSANNISFTPSGKDYLIRCLNPEHDDNNPSCRVDKLSGITHCFSCGWKRNLFKHFGVFSNNTPIKVAKLKQKLQELREANIEIGLPEGATPYTQSFRGLSTVTLKHFEAFYTHKVEALEDRIVFPIRDITGRLVATIGRHVLSDANPRYKVYPSGKPLPLFPALLEDNNKKLVLVEGIFDMLNLYDKGMRNVVCTFGTSTISTENVSNKLMPYKVQGVEKVYIMYDADKAGKEAAASIKPIIESDGFIVEVLELEEGTDPGDMSQESVDMMKEYTS